MEQAEDADYAAVYGVFDPSGRRLASDEHPGVRAARGERFENVPVDWVTPAGARSIVVSAHTVPLGEARRRGARHVRGRHRARGGPPPRRAAGRGVRAARQLARPATRSPSRSRDLAVPAFADWGFVELLRPDGTHRARGDGDGRPGRARDGRASTTASTRSTRTPPVGSPQVIRTRRAAADRRDAAEIPRRSPRPTRDSARCCSGLGFRSTMIVPLRARGARDRRPRARDGRVEPPLRRAGPGRRPGSSRTAARSRSTTRGSTPSSARRSRPRARPARRSTRSSAASPTRSPRRRPTARSSTPTRRRCGWSACDSVQELLAAPPGEVAARFEMTDERRRRRSTSSASPAAARCAASTPSR